MSRIFKGIVSVAACAALAAPAQAALELAVNGNFETGTFANWTQFPTGPGQQTVVSPGAGGSNFAGRINNGVTFSNSLFKQANVGIGIVTPGETVTIKFDARGSYATPGGVAFAEFFSELSGGGTSSAVILGGAPLALDPNPSVWKSFTFTAVTGPDVSGGVTLQLGATNGPGQPTEMFYDNISITVVPEPASLSALGIAALGLVRRRRA